MSLQRLEYTPTREDLRELLRLASPIVLIQVGLVSMGVVDTIMVGHVSATALAAVALGNLYTFGLSIFGLGVLLVNRMAGLVLPATSKLLIDDVIGQRNVGLLLDRKSVV